MSTKKKVFKVPMSAKRFKGGQATIARVGGNKLFDSYFKPLKVGGTENE
jgi:hypothetical protein